MADTYLEIPPMRDDYSLTLVEPEFIAASVRPKQFLHINQAECITCEGCVDICPWHCIHYLSMDAIADVKGVTDPTEDVEAYGFFMVDEEVCTRCQLCIDRCPTNVITLGKFTGSLADQTQQAELPSPWEVDTGARDHKNGYVYGVRGM